MTGRDGGRDIDLRQFAARGHAALRPAGGTAAAASSSPPICASAWTKPTPSPRASSTPSTSTSREAASTRPAEARYVPVWEPAEEPRRSDLARGGSAPSSGAPATAPTTAGSRSRSSTAAATPSTAAASPPPRPLLPRPALAVHLGLGPLSGVGHRRGVPRRPHRRARRAGRAGAAERAGAGVVTKSLKGLGPHDRTWARSWTGA